MSAATIRRCEWCDEPLQTPVELKTGRCLICHLAGPPSAPPATPPSRATALALMAKHHAITVAISAQDRHYERGDESPVICGSCGHPIKAAAPREWDGSGHWWHRGCWRETYDGSESVLDYYR